MKKSPDVLVDRPVKLADASNAQIFLGCIVDAGGYLQRWVELWVQRVESAADSACPRPASTNQAFDDLWRRQVRAFGELNPTLLIRTGWETDHPPPVWIDVAAGRTVNPVDPDSGDVWRLCVDDDRLAAAGLPPYHDVVNRYLHVSELGDDSYFVPLTPGAPTGPRTRDAVPGTERLIPFNPAGGLMMVCSREGIALEDYLDMLSGLSIDAATAGLPTWDRTEALESSLAGDGWLYLGDHGRDGRLIETFHLKLRVLADAVNAVRAAVERSGRPLLNVSAESFRVTLAEPGRGLPFLWTARTALVRPGDAIDLPVPDGTGRCFIRGWSGTHSACNCGVPCRIDARFETPPTCSAACDLYALGVLAVRALLVDRRTTLDAALAHVLDLRARLSEERDPAVPLASRIRELFVHDSRWLDDLGPHRLVYESASPHETLDLIPSALWWNALAMIVRMFPDAGPDSRCADFNHAPSHAPHAMFIAVADELRDLLVRTRSLVLMDWKTNREIHSILLARLTGAADGFNGSFDHVE